MGLGSVILVGHDDDGLLALGTAEKLHASRDSRKKKKKREEASRYHAKGHEVSSVKRSRCLCGLLNQSRWKLMQLESHWYHCL